MPRYRRIIAALGVIAAVVIVFVVVDMICVHAPPPPASETARDNTTQPRTSHSQQVFDLDSEFPDEELGKVTEPPPEPNVTGIVVDEDGNPVQGALVSACHLVPYLMEGLDTDGLEGKYDFGPEPKPEKDKPERMGALRGAFGPDDADVYPFPEATDNDGEFVDEWGMPIDVGVPWGKAPQCLTDENGAFAIHVCDKLWYGMTAYKKGYDSPFRVFHEPQEGIRLVLYGPGSIIGRVLDADTAEPVPRFTVTLSWNFASSEEFGGEPEPAERRRIPVDNERGEFRLDKIPSDLCVEVNAEGYLPERVGSIGPVAGRTITTKIRMHRAARLVGQVVWASNDQPVADAVVQVKTNIQQLEYLRDFFPSVFILENGTFELPMLPAGRATIFVAQRDPVDPGFIGSGEGDFAPLAALYLHSESINLLPGRTTDVTLRVSDRKPGKIRGRTVRKGTGKPMPGISVFLNRESAWGAQTSDQLTTESDSEGRFEFANVDQGTYELATSDSNYVGKEQSTIRLKSGETVENLVLELDAWGRLVGSVRDATGEPIKTRVSCSADTGWTYETDDKGNYEFERVVPGHATVCCGLPGTEELLAKRLIEIAPGTTTRADFLLPETYSIMGRITIADVPIQSAIVQLYSDLSAADLTVWVIGDPYDHMKEVDNEGRFRIENVPPGKYTLFAEIGSCSALIVRRPLEVVSSDVEVMLELPTGVITGRVLDAETGEPVPRAFVFVRKVQEFPETTECAENVKPIMWAQTDPYHGSYTFPALNDGRYVITTLRDEYDFGRVEIDVVEGKQVGTGDILLSDGCQVRCRVATEQADAAASNVTVTVRDSSQGLVTIAWPSPHSEFDECFIGCLLPGEYVLEADSETTAWQRKELTVVEGARNVLDFRLPEGETLVVKVRDAAGEPVHGAIPNIKDALGRTRLWRTGRYEEDWNLAIQSASDGQGVTRIEHLLPGTYSLTVEAAGYKSAKQSVEIREGAAVEIEVRLERLAADEIVGRCE